MHIPIPPKARFLLYIVGTLVFGVVALLSFFKVIDPEVAASVSAQLVSFLGLFGVTVAGTAAYNINKQRHDGTLDRGPELDPADKIITGLNEVLQQKAAADAAVEKVKDIVVSQTRDIPVLGPLAQEVIDRLK